MCGHRGEPQAAVRFYGDERRTGARPGAAVNVGPARRRLGARQRIQVRHRGHEPGSATAARPVCRQRDPRDLAARAQQLRCPTGRRRADAPGIPQRPRCDRRLRGRPRGRRPLHERVGAERESLEAGLCQGERRGRFRHGPPPHAGDHYVDDARRAEQRAPAGEQRRGLVTQPPHEAGERRHKGEGRHQGGGREAYLERGAVDRTVQTRDGFRRIERRAPRQRECGRGEQ